VCVSVCELLRVFEEFVCFPAWEEREERDDDVDIDEDEFTIARRDKILIEL